MIFFPSPYRYSSECNPVNRSVLTIDSNVFWCTTVFNTDTILSYINALKVINGALGSDSDQVESPLRAYMESRLKAENE